MKVSYCAKQWVIGAEAEPKPLHVCTLKFGHEGSHYCSGWHLIGTEHEYKCTNTQYREINK